MIVEERIQRFRSQLQQEGYHLLPFEGEHLLVKYEGVPMFIHLEEEDEGYVNVLMPGFFRLSDVAEKAQAVRAAHETTRMCKVAKMYVGPEGDAMWASAEAFVGSDESFFLVLDRTLSSVKNAARFFVEQMAK